MSSKEELESRQSGRPCEARDILVKRERYEESFWSMDADGNPADLHTSSMGQYQTGGTWGVRYKCRNCDEDMLGWISVIRHFGQQFLKDVKAAPGDRDAELLAKGSKT